MKVLSDLVAEGHNAGRSAFLPSGTGGGSSDPLDLTATNVAAPAAGTVRLFRREIAGQQVPAFMEPDGRSAPLQPALAYRAVARWNPPGNATTFPGLDGMVTPNTTGFTVQARNVTVGNALLRARRIGFITAATAGSVGQFRVAQAQYTIGDGSQGGFTFVMRFGVSDPNVLSGAMMFVGMRAPSTPTNVSPFDLTNCIGVAHDSFGSLYFMVRGAVSGNLDAAMVNFGSGAYIPVPNQDLLELIIHAPVGGSGVHMQLTLMNTNQVASAFFLASVCPLPNQLLAAPWCYRSNNTSAVQVGLDVASIYIES
jgi:hypothetical protein